MTISNRDVQRQRREHERQFEPNHDDSWGTITEVAGSTSPPGRGNQTWINMFGLNTSVLPVWNDTTLRKPGTPVQLGNDPKPPGLRVIGAYTKAEVPNSTVDVSRYNTPVHGENHQYLSETLIGDDPVKIYQPALQMLKTTGNGVNLIVSTQAYGSFPGADTDMTAGVPATAGQVRRVLVYYDRAQNKMATIQGTAVLDNGVIPIPYPEAPENTTESACIKLSNGQTSISTVNHVEDVRDFLGTGSDLALEDLIDVTFTSLANGEVLVYDAAENEWVNGAGGSTVPGGADTQVQFNDGGVFGGDAGLVYDKTNDRLGVGGVASPDNTIHAHKGSAGSVSANANAPVVIENSGNSFIHVLHPDASEGGILIGDPTDVISGAVIVNNQNAMNLRAKGNTTQVVIGNGVAIGTGTTEPATSARLEIGGTDGAVLLPRLTTTERDALTAANGMIFYNSTDGRTQAREGGTWFPLRLIVGTDVQAWNDNLDDLAALTPTKGNVIVGNGTDWVALGVGTDTHVLTADAAEAAGVKWAAQAGGGPGGSDTQIQYNNGGVLGGASGFTYDDTTGTVDTLATTDGALDYAFAAVRSATTTNIVADVARFDRIVGGGSGANNIGSALRFGLENAAGTLKDAMSVRTDLTTATNGSETARVRFDLLSSGSEVVPLTIDGTGGGRVGVGTASPAQTLDVNGMTKTANLLLDDNTAFPKIQISRGGADLGVNFDWDFPNVSTAAVNVRILRNTNTSGGKTVTIFRGNGTSTSDHTFTAGGGYQVGAPTGGDKGVGTINVSGNVYKNNVAYTSPDYALEHWATGKIEKYKANEGAADYRRMSLDEVEQYIRQHYHLPRISREPAGIFDMADMALEKIEELFTYVIELHHRLKGLEV